MADEFEGTLTGVYADDFDSGVSDTRWLLETDDDETLPVLPTKLPALRPGANEVEVEGEIEDGWLVGTVSWRTMTIWLRHPRPPAPARQP